MLVVPRILFKFETESFYYITVGQDCGVPMVGGILFFATESFYNLIKGMVGNLTDNF